LSSSFFLTSLPPPRSPLFPYTTLFRPAAVRPPAGFVTGDARRRAAARLRIDACPGRAEARRVLGGVRGRSGRRRRRGFARPGPRSEEHTSELQSLAYLVCRLLLEKKKI